MIPLTTEHEWFEHLKELPPFYPPTINTVILSPHPDDETLGAGGLIAYLRKNEIDVTVIAVTNGENAYQDVPFLGEIRVLEQNKALYELGIKENKIIRFNLSDSGLEKEESKFEQLLFPYINKNVHLIAPWIGDFHSDHKAVGRVAARIVKEIGASLTFYFFWTWHQGNLDTINQLPLKKYVLYPKLYKLKMLALSYYRSQFDHPIKPILTENLLKPARREFEVFLNYEY